MGRPSFDVRTRPWIAARVGAEPVSVGWEEFFLRAHELTEVEIASPPAAAVFWRIAYVLTARITGLDEGEFDTWHDRRQDALDLKHFDSDRVRRCFDRDPDRWDLLDTERPWLQDPRLAEQCGKASGINKLVFGRAAGNSQPWHIHHTDAQPRPVAVEDAPWHLLAQLGYGPSGRCTARAVGTVKEANTTAGPLRSTLSFHPVGATVFESLLAGLPALASGEPQEADVAPWEADSLPDPLGPPTRPAGYAALVGRFQHAVLLVPSADGATVTDAYITWASRHKHATWTDPYLIYQTSKEGNRYPRPADANRAIFRDLDALLCHDTGDPGVLRPAIMNDVQQLPWNLVIRLRLRAFGFDQDGQTRDKQVFVAATPPVLGWVEEANPSAAAAISRWRHTAEDAGQKLAWAAKRAWIAINDPSNGDGRVARRDLGEGPWAGRSAQRYWSAAERIFWRLVTDADFDAADIAFYRAATAAFDEVTDTAQRQPRTARAVTRAREIIRPRPTMINKKGA